MKKILIIAILLTATFAMAKAILICTDEDGCKVVYIKE